MPRPLQTSLGLLGVGVVVLGGALLLLPRAQHGAPSTAKTGELESVPTPVGAVRATSNGATSPQRIATTAPPSDPATMATMATESAATATGVGSEGGPSVSGVATASSVASASSASSGGGDPSATPRSNVAVAPAAGSVGGVPGVVGVVPVPGTGDPRGPQSAIGGGPRPEASSLDGGVGDPSTTAGDAGAGGVSSAGDGGLPGYYGVPLAAPVYGAPPASTSTSGPVTSGAAGDAAPLWTGGSLGFGGGSGGNGGGVNPRPAIATSFLLSMSDAQDPESAWSSLSPYLRPSDVVVARVGGDGATSAAYLDWGDRVRTDAPLVGYVLAMSDVGKLQALIARGLPATVTGAGPAQTDALDAPTLTALSAAVHGAGRRFFVSTSTTPRVALGEIGARADVVELVVPGGSTDTIVHDAAVAIASLRSAGRPTVFVRLPEAASGSTSAASTFLSTLSDRAAGVGASIPYGTGTSFLGDLRASP